MKKLFAALALMSSVSAIAFVSPADAAVTKTQAARAVTVEQVYGPLYGRYKAQFPSPQLNWVNNGCSIPAIPSQYAGNPAVKAAVKAYNAVAGHYGAEFQKSCDRHDFGYRNHKLTGISRATVDTRLYNNMKHQCDVNHTDGLPPWIACYAAAKTMYTAVHAFGWTHW